MTWNGDWDSFAGDMDPEPSYGGSTSYSYSYSSIDDYIPPSPLYTFHSEEELVTSNVFQKHLGMSLAHKDKKIMELMNELLRMGVK